MIDHRKRANIKIDSHVEIVQKHHQRTDERTMGVVAKLLTKSAQHPYGIKVQLENGLVGRVKKVIE